MNTQVLENSSRNNDLSQPLFDANGRCIPDGLKAPVNVNTRHYFKIRQPEVDNTAVFNRISKHLGQPDKLNAQAFSERLDKIMYGLQSVPATRNIACGVKVPFFIPKSAAGDIGTLLESKYMPALSTAYSEVFPKYQFKNQYKESIKNRFTVSPESRHDVLLAKLANEDVVGYYFPCLLEYSIPATRELMSKLPENMLLAGGFDTAAALIGSPALLFNKISYPPLLWFAALEAEKPEAGYFFEAYGYNLTFNRKPHFGTAAEYWATGLVVLG